MRFVRGRGFDGVLVALGIAAAFCMIGAPLALVAALTIIGLPITLMMAAIPSIFLFLLTARLAMFAFPFRGGWIAAATVAAAIFLVVPWAVNMRLDAEARALAAGDFNSVGEPFEPTSMAVLTSRTGFSRDETPCDDFCLRALLSGSLDRVLFSSERTQLGLLDPDAEAVAFRMERRETCPAVKLRSAVNALKIEASKQAQRPADPAEVMRLQIASGNCLIMEPARVGDAQSVVRIGSIRSGDTPFSAGLDLFADTVRADRISLLLRSGTAFEERYRWTGVETHKLLPVLLPSYVTGYGLEIANGFLRRTERINIPEKYYDGPDRTSFFKTTLGLALSIDSASVDDLRTAALNQRLDAPGDLDAVAAQVAGDFFDDLAMRRDLTPAQAEQGLRIVADHRIQVPRAVYVLAQYADKLSADIQRRTAEILVARLIELDRPVERDKLSAFNEQASALGGAIRELPAGAVTPHRGALTQVAHQEALRVPAWQALVRLADIGADAVPTFLYLIDDADRFRKDHGNAWQHPYLAGLIGTCKLGGEGRTALEPLLARLDRGQMPMHASYGELAVNTLVAIGGETEAIWSRVKAADQKAERQRFDRIVERARRNAPDCSY